MSGEREQVPWALLVGHAETRARYEQKVYRRGPQQCAYWIGAISDSGHGKLRAGPAGKTSRIVSAHVLGYGIEHGAQALDKVELVRHTCDSPSCQNSGHWLPGTRQDNVQDYASRSRLAGHALADTRGAAGRAVAIREAIRTTLAKGGDAAAVEAAIREASLAGQPGGAWQDGLWELPAEQD
ncbi:hypothetical protein ACIRPK_34020 [Kitasatospora sp. NPDC101801]|uniref:hypothetical protein n=1 Tax=Kitasatospora sp. NPDC101801 TaxID=3364103 RepID=UPI00380CF97C